MTGVDMDNREADWLLFGAGGPKPDPQLRLFCFHYAGGGGSIFRHWARELPDEVEVVAVQLPGRENRLDEPLLHSMGDVAPPIVEALKPLLDRPFAFFGHSTGALIGFEVARALRLRRRMEPRLLIASAQTAPEVKPPVVRHVLDDASFIEVLRGCNGTPEAILGDPVLLDLLLPRIRADGAVFETYCYEQQPPLDCRIVVFHGINDCLVSDVDLAGWARETSGGFRRCAFAGDHFFIHAEEASVLDEINHELNALLSDTSFKLNG